MKHRRIWTALIVLVAGAGAFSLAHAADEEEDYGSELKSNALSALEVLGHGFVKPTAAVDIARAAAKGVPSEIELARRDHAGTPAVVWEVELDDGTAIHKVAIDVWAGEVLKVWDDAEDADDAGKAAKLLEGKKTDLEAALAALSARDCGFLLGIQVEVDEGSAVLSGYTSRNGAMNPIRIDLATGEVEAGKHEKDGGGAGGDGD